MQSTRARRAIFAILMVLGIPAIAVAEFEQPKTFSAKALLPADLLSGKHFTVKDEVTSDGLFYQYTVTSPFGNFRAPSTTALKQLVHEIETIAVMKTIKTEDTAKKALQESGAKTVEGLKNLFSNPEETLEGAATGVGSLFDRASGTIGRRDTTNTEDSKVQQLIGFSKSKGQIATQYGVGVYSENSLLQEELDRLAWADYLGGLGVGVATSVVPGVGGVVLTTSGAARLLNEAINTTPAAELWVQNKEKLLAMGINSDTVELFLNNRNFSPALATLTVASLAKMEQVENRELFVKTCLQASNSQMARILTSIAAMTANYHEQVEPLKRLVPMARLTMGVTKSGKAVVLLPTDHLIWSERVATAATAVTENSAGPPELWVLGDFSEMAETNLTKAGWKLTPQAGTKLINKK